MIDRNHLGDTVAVNSIPVRISEHGESIPPETHYKAIEWRDGRLVFEVDGHRHIFDIARRQIESRKH